eukprot:10292219-Alexandrium_andersonii.AAC.1
MYEQGRGAWPTREGESPRGVRGQALPAPIGARRALSPRAPGDGGLLGPPGHAEAAERPSGGDRGRAY